MELSRVLVQGFILICILEFGRVRIKSFMNLVMEMIMVLAGRLSQIQLCLNLSKVFKSFMSV